MVLSVRYWNVSFLFPDRRVRRNWGFSTWKGVKLINRLPKCFLQIAMWILLALAGQTLTGGLWVQLRGFLFFFHWAVVVEHSGVSSSLPNILAGCRQGGHPIAGSAEASLRGAKSWPRFMVSSPGLCSWSHCVPTLRPWRTQLVGPSSCSNHPARSKPPISSVETHQI